MIRRGACLLAWMGVVTTAVTMALSSPLWSAELRGRSGARPAHRLASLEEEIPVSEMTADEAAEEGMPAAKAASGPKAVPEKTYSAPVTQSWDTNVINNDFSDVVGACEDGTCGPCDDGSFSCSGTWGSFEYLLWWRKERNIPALVTTTSNSVNQDTDGQLGQPGTVILLGPSSFEDHMQPGGRFDLGVWLDPCHSFGVGTRFTALGDDDLNYTVASGTTRVLTVPFFNLDPAVNSEDTLVVASPLDGTTGSINVQGHNEVYFGDVYMRIAGARTNVYQIDVIGGYGWSRINEDLSLRTLTTSGGTNIEVRDRFKTSNEYHGGMIGLMGNFDRGAWSVSGVAKATLANVHQSVEIDGLTRIGGVTQSLTGLFAQNSNIGTRNQDQFAVIPEVGVNWNYKMGNGWSATVGYTVVYWSQALRPGQQINRLVDPTQTSANPSFRFNDTTYIAQGLNFGLQWNY